jgi:hypothetical protein
MDLGHKKPFGLNLYQLKTREGISMLHNIDGFQRKRVVSVLEKT